MAAPGATTRFIDGEVTQRLMKGVDLSVLILGGVVLGVMFLPMEGPNASAILGFLAVVLGLGTVLIIRGLGLYDPRRWGRGAVAAAKSLLAAMAAGLGFYLVSGLAFGAASQNWALGWVALAAMHFPLTRLAAQAWALPAEQAGRFVPRIAIVGGGKAAEEAINTLENSRGLAVNIVGLFDDRNDNRSPESVRAVGKLGKIADLASYARHNRVDLIIVAIPLSAEQRLLQILKRLWELPVDIRISGQSSTLKLSPRAYSHLGNLPLLAVFDRPLSGWGLFMKETMDRIIASLAIIMLAPVMAAVALAVRLESKGPVIFRQKRYGFNNELIEVFKFRSMYTDMSDATASKLVTKGDPRVTKVGRIIRKTSLDELPQLFNVLTGQLSLVGPRPHATQAKAAEALYEQVVDGYFARHKVKPGITGWAQINGWRGETDTREKIEQRVKYDLDYIDRWSLGLDLTILAKTPFALLKSENAY